MQKKDKSSRRDVDSRREADSRRAAPGRREEVPEKDLRRASGGAKSDDKFGKSAQRSQQRMSQ